MPVWKPTLSANFQRATDFYGAHREAMDEGAIVGWEARYNDDEISALQHGMNLKLQDEASFQSEYQNDPFPDDMGNDSLLSIDEIAAKINGLPERIVPLYCDHVTAFIDIQKALLFYTVVAWGEDFTGAVIEPTVSAPIPLTRERQQLPIHCWRSRLYRSRLCRHRNNFSERQENGLNIHLANSLNASA